MELLALVISLSLHSGGNTGLKEFTKAIEGDVTLSIVIRYVNFKIMVNDEYDTNRALTLQKSTRLLHGSVLLVPT